MSRQLSIVTAQGLFLPDGKTGVQYIRPELVAMRRIYALILDCLNGEFAVKDKGDVYLRRPNAEDTSAENQARFDSYLKGAVFYNVARRTNAGMLGQIYMRDPLLEIPPDLETVTLDVTGAGVSIDQLSKKACAFTLGFGRCGLFTDYPNTNGEAATKEQLSSGNIRPTMSLHAPWTVINWRTKVRGAKTLLSLVVINDDFIIDDDGFELKTENQFKVLRLVDDVYKIQIWVMEEDMAVMKEEYTPLDARGQTLDEIPFIFIGSVNNDSSVDEAPMYDLCSLNIAHYRNSADYEESSFITGQPTVWVAGLTEEWITKVLKGKVPLGSRGGLALPVNASAGLMQSNPNTMPFEAMEHKERQMVALGAQLVEQKTVQRTATEAGLDASAEGSTLSTIANNVSAAFTWALEWCAVFLMQGGVEGQEAGIKYQLNDDFELATLTPEARRQLVSEWQAQAITFEEMRAGLRKAGSAFLDDKEAAKQLADEAQQTLDAEVEKAKAVAEVTGTPPVGSE